MKSQRRHELQHNELAQWLANAGEALKPYQNIIFTAVVIALVLLAGYAWWSRTSAAETSEAWNALNVGLEKRSLTDLTQVVEQYPDTNVARTASVLSGDFRLINGSMQLFHNKAVAQQELSKAITSYESVLRWGERRSLLERATFGLARAKESKGELEEAERYYGDVVTNWPHGAYAAASRQRLDDLKRPEIRRLYDDFRKFDPAPAYTNEFDVPGKRPGFDMQDVPEEKPGEFPDLDLNLDEEEPEEKPKEEKQ